MDVSIDSNNGGLTMKRTCISCELIFNLREEGYLFILETNLIKRVYPNAIEKNGGIYLPFHSKEDIMEKVETILTLPNIDPKIEANILPEMCIPLVMFPLHQVALKIKEYETIEIIRDTEFISYFQPIVSLQDEGVIGYEALLRDPLSRVSPSKLFKVAQATGLHHLLDMRARQVAIKSRVGQIPDGVKSFINFLPSTIYQPQFSIKNTMQSMKQHNVRSEDVVFEVVETEKIADINHLKSIFNVYKQEGIKVALDDYGTGNSTFEVLEKLVPDYVKIDRSLIMNCDQDMLKQKHLMDIVKTSKELGIISLAEGIERKEELEICRAIGIELAQGYYFGKPQSKPQFFVV